MRATIEAAQRADWRAGDSASEAVVSALAGASDVAALERYEQAAKTAIDDLHAQLESFTAKNAKPEGASLGVASRG